MTAALAMVLALSSPMVALTFDDLPAAGAANPDRDPALTTGDIRAINAAILATLRAHHAPAIGFVNEAGVSGFPDAAARRAVLEQWIAAGMDLGNHTFAHADFNGESVEEFERDVEKGEGSIRPLMAAAGKKLDWFRFPMNHTGDTAAKHDAAARFLAGRGYRLATCTIENEDYEFGRAFRQALLRNDADTEAKLRAEYLRYTAAEIDDYAALHQQVFGRAVPQVMLLHANRLNAQVLEQVLRLFEERGYRFVTLSEAQADEAFRTPELVTKYGPMWGYRWASALHVKVDGGKESEPPEWVAKYGLAAAADHRLDSAAVAAMAQRASTAPGFVVPVNDLILAEANRLAATPEGRKHVTSALQRRPAQLSAIRGALEAQKLPAQLEAVVLIESGYDNIDAGPNGAGIWQFIVPTAQHYGLHVEKGRDERMNVELESKAAARYLAELQRQFGDWPLALAAYTQGETHVRTAIEREKTRDAWELIRRGALDRYPAKVMAAALLLADPAAAGF